MTSRTDVISLLLDSGVDPFATDLSGNDGFMSACIWERTGNAKFWLKRFPDWDLERKNKAIGGYALSHAVFVGPYRLELVKVLVEHGASLQHRTDAGSSVLISLCESEDCDPEWYDTESMYLVCDSGYIGGGMYECDVSVSHYMRGDSVCELRECVQYLENVQTPSQQPIRIYYEESIEVSCSPGYVGGGLWSCGPTGELYGGTNCTRNFCDVPTVANSNFNTVIQPYLPYPA